MPEFVNPFSGVVPRKLTKEELIRAIRLNISAEHEAIHLYMAHADATDDPLAKKVLTDIANEEREHIGEFQQLLRYLAPDEDIFIANGMREVEEMQAQLSGVAPAGSPSSSETMAVESSGMESTPEEGMEEAAEAESSIAPTNAGVRTIGSLLD